MTPARCCAVVALALALAACPGTAEPPAPTTPAPDTSSVAAPVADDGPLGEIVARSRDADHDVRLQAIRELAALTDPAAVPALADALDDVDLRVRRDAATALAALGTAAAPAVPALARALDDEYAIVRQRSLHALTVVGDAAARDAVRAWLGRVGVEELDQALDALATLGVREAVPDIAPWAQHPDPYVHRAAARALVRLGGDAARDVVRDLLDAEDASVRCTAAWAYGRLADADADAPLWTMVDDADPVVGLCARGALGRLGHDEQLDPLTSAALSGTPAERDSAVMSLAMIGTSASHHRLIDLLAPFHDASGAMTNGAMHAIVALGDDALPSLTERLGDGDPLTRRLVAEALAASGTSAQLGALGEARARESDPDAAAALDDAVRAIQARTPPPDPTGTP